MEKACGGIVAASAYRQNRRPAPTFQISPRERRATDKQEPRFQRKQDRVSTFGLTGKRGKRCRRQMRPNRPGNPGGAKGRARVRSSSVKKLFPKRPFPEKVCLKARCRLNCRVRIRSCSSRSPIIWKARRWISPPSRPRLSSSPPSRSLWSPSPLRPSPSRSLRPRLPSWRPPHPSRPSPRRPSLSQPSLSWSSLS